MQIETLVRALRPQNPTRPTRIQFNVTREPRLLDDAVLRPPAWACGQCVERDRFVRGQSKKLSAGSTRIVRLDLRAEMSFAGAPQG
jgi:hypothetical protein